MQSFDFTDLDSRDQSLRSEPRVWIFLDESFAPDATAFVMRRQAQHAIIENFIIGIIGRISVRLFALPGASCPPRHEQRVD